MRVHDDNKAHIGFRRLLNRFASADDGYAIVLSLVAMPLILGMALLVIDGSRVQSLHTDLQNAVDAMALSGARELDGRNDAIPRARTAVEELTQNEAWFGGGGTGMNFGSKIFVVYDSADAAASTVEVTFLTDIPGDPGIAGDDDTPLTGATLTGLATTNSNDAKYVLVRAKPQSLVTMFPLPVGGRDSLNVAAEAVAAYAASACDVTPIYICNPFDDGTSFNEHFEQGDLYGRQLELQFTGAASAGPGTFGFLRVAGTGANDLAHALATNSPGVCYAEDGVDLEPGATVGPVEFGLNTRVGLYGGSFNGYKNDPLYRPDQNVRIGQSNPGVGNSCKTYDPEEDPTDPVTAGEAMALPEGTTMVPNGGGEISTDDSWNLDKYWDVAHGGHASNPYTDPTYTPPAAPATVYNFTPSYPPTASGTPSTPSRRDVYQYEMENSTCVSGICTGMLADESPNGETGAPMCHSGYNVDDYSGERREIFAAVVNCHDPEVEAVLKGAATDVPTEAFARMFMSKPVITDGADKSISLEVIDVTGEGGLGTLEEFLREESVLVR